MASRSVQAIFSLGCFSVVDVTQEADWFAVAAYAFSFPLYHTTRWIAHATLLRCKVNMEDNNWRYAIWDWHFHPSCLSL